MKPSHMASCSSRRISKKGNDMNLKSPCFFSGKMFHLPTYPKIGRGAAKGLRRRDLGKQLWLYAVHAPENALVKIGVTTDLDARMTALRSQCAVDVILTSAISFDPARLVGVCEDYTHKVLASRRAHGEWFKISPSCADTIIRMSAFVVRNHVGHQFQQEAAEISGAST